MFQPPAIPPTATQQRAARHTRHRSLLIALFGANAGFALCGMLACFGRGDYGFGAYLLAGMVIAATIAVGLAVVPEES